MFDILVNPDPNNAESEAQVVAQVTQEVAVTFATNSDIETSASIEFENIDGVDYFGGQSAVQTGFQSITVDLSPYRGQIIDIQFNNIDNGGRSTIVLVDEINLNLV